MFTKWLLNLADLVRTFLPGSLFFILCGTALAAFLVVAAKRKRAQVSRFEGWQLLLCMSLAFIPLLILYGLSVETPIHIFASVTVWRRFLELRCAGHSRSAAYPRAL